MVLMSSKNKINILSDTVINIQVNNFFNDLYIFQLCTINGKHIHGV